MEMNPSNYSCVLIVQSPPVNKGFLNKGKVCTLLRLDGGIDKTANTKPILEIDLVNSQPNEQLQTPVEEAQAPKDFPPSTLISLSRSNSTPAGSKIGQLLSYSANSRSRSIIISEEQVTKGWQHGDQYAYLMNQLASRMLMLSEIVRSIKIYNFERYIELTILRVYKRVMILSKRLPFYIKGTDSSLFDRITLPYSMGFCNMPENQSLIKEEHSVHPTLSFEALDADSEVGLFLLRLIVSHYYRSNHCVLEDNNILSLEESTQFDQNGNLKNILRHLKEGNEFVVHSIIDLSYKLLSFGLLVRGIKVTAASCTLLIDIAGRKNSLRLVIPIETITEKLSHDTNDEQGFPTLQESLSSIENPPNCDTISDLKHLMTIYSGDIDSIRSNPILRQKKQYTLRRVFHQQRWKGYSTVTEEVKQSHTKYVSIDRLSQTDESLYESDYQCFIKRNAIKYIRKEARQNALARRPSPDSSIVTLAEMMYLATDLLALDVYKAERLALASKSIDVCSDVV